MKEIQETSLQQTKLEVSIVIATHKRPESLRALLTSLAQQFDPERHELLLAENGTPAALPIRLPVGSTHLHDPRAGKCRVQNRALALAKGKIVAFLDDDLVVAAQYLSAVEAFFADHTEYAAMKGRILPLRDPSIIGPMAAYLDLPLADHGDQVIEVRGVLGANMAFRAEVLRRVGPFDERLGPGAAGHEEETEMSQRLRHYGYRIGYSPDAVVFHEVDAARASHERYVRIARERGYCRTLHERHSKRRTVVNLAIAASRLFCARAMRSTVARIAREERRLAIAQGIMHGLRSDRSRSDQR